MSSLPVGGNLLSPRAAFGVVIAFGDSAVVALDDSCHVRHTAVAHFYHITVEDFAI